MESKNNNNNNNVDKSALEKEKEKQPNTSVSDFFDEPIDVCLCVPAHVIFSIYLLFFSWNPLKWMTVLIKNSMLHSL